MNNIKLSIKRVLLLSAVLWLAACTASPPKNVDNICEIFREKDWYDDAKDAQEEWGSSIPTMMAIIHQESRFVADAQPPRKWYLGFIPGPRPSSAYGYPQAKDGTWETYQRSTGNYSHDRDDFADAMMFVGWYNHQSYKRNKVGKWDTKNLYLNYHEGHGGYRRGTHHKKPWLMKVSKKVGDKAWTYKKQLQSCQKELEDDGWWFF